MSLAGKLDRATDRTAGSYVPFVMLLAATSIAAGVIHAAVVPEHLEEAWVLGVFFILAAGFQISWAIAMVFGPSEVLYAAGVLANGALVGIWVVSRTIGVPIGPHTWMPEPLGAADITATLLELLLVIGSLVLFRRRVHADAHSAGCYQDGKGRISYVSDVRLHAAPRRSRERGLPDDRGPGGERRCRLHGS